MKKLLVLTCLMLSTSAFSQEVYHTKFSTEGKNIIGVWLEAEEIATIYGQMKVVLYTENSAYYMALIETDGYIVHSMTKRTISGATRYYDNDSNFGEYYIVSESGLKVYDSQGYIATYTKSKL